MKRLPKVALLMDVSRAFDRGLLRGIARYVSLHRPWAFVRPPVFYQQASTMSRQLIDQIRREAPGGIVLSYAHLSEKLLALGTPLLVVPVESIVPGTYQILANNQEVATAAADHLLGLGLQNFAYAGFDRALWSLARRDGFSRRMAERGFDVRVHLLPLSFRAAKRAGQEAVLAKWLKSLPKPVGIMACNDEFARTLSESCLALDLRVPDDVALIGVDNDELICTLNSPPLSSVAFAVAQAGYEAAEMLDQLMAGRKPARNAVTVHAGQLVARQSTDIMAIADEEIVKALRFIKENSFRSIMVDEVVDATLLGHRMLNYRFQRVIGRTLVKEISRQRAAHVARQLLDTNDSIARISCTAGFDRVADMARFFQREMGISPRVFRQQRQGPREAGG